MTADLDVAVVSVCDAVNKGAHVTANEGRRTLAKVSRKKLGNHVVRIE